MNAQQIINKFETYVDDNTELSSTDELDLLNKVYNDVWTDRPWEFSKKAYSGSISGTTISLPTDFAYISENASYTDVSQNNVNGNQAPKLVWVSGVYYILINYSDRRQYSNKSGYCWVDLTTDKLTFSTSVNGTVDFDYVCFPATLTLSDTPIFPAQFHDVLYHLMAVDDYIIQQSDKAKSYASENQAKASYWLEKMRYWNAQLICN